AQKRWFCGRARFEPAPAVKPARSTTRESYARAKTLARFLIFTLKTVNQLPGRGHFVDSADALTAAPNILPGLGAFLLRLVEVHLGRVGLRKIVGVHARIGDGRLQVVACNAGKVVGVDEDRKSGV